MPDPNELVTDPAAADFLTSPTTRYLLGPFMHGETTMAEAARSLGMVLNTLHRRVAQMVALRLVEIAREEVRGGHRVKLYRVTQKAFAVPIEATTNVSLETYVEAGFKGSATILSRGTAKAMARSAPRWGLRVYLLRTGAVIQQATALDEEGRPLPAESVEGRSWYGAAGVRLTPEAARAFRRELQELYDRLRQGASDEGEWHFFFAGFTPT